MNKISCISFGVILSFFVHGVARADQKAAILRIQQLGGTVMSVAQNDPRLSVKIPAKTPDGRTVKDADLAPLADLVRTQPTDAGVIEIDLRSVEVGDQALSYIRGLTQLEVINLSRTRVTDTGLSQISGLVNLEHLNLYGTAVTDAGLKSLKSFKKLKRLFLSETKVTVDGTRKFWQMMEASGNNALYINIGGDALRIARKNTRGMVERGEAAICHDSEKDRKEAAIRFVIDEFNGRVDAILWRAKFELWRIKYEYVPIQREMEKEVKDAFELVNKKGIDFNNARIQQPYLDSRLGELHCTVAAPEEFGNW